MTVKWSAFAAGSAIASANELVGLQSSVNVRWTFTQLSTYMATIGLAGVSGGQVLGPLGTTSLPGFAFASDPDSGIYGEFGLLNVASSGVLVAAFQGSGTPTQYLQAVLAVRNTLATPAAASAVAAVTFGSALVGIYWGTGDPNTALTAPKGSLFIRTDGSGVANRMYINTDSSTAWTSFATAG